VLFVIDVAIYRSYEMANQRIALGELNVGNGQQDSGEERCKTVEFDRRTGVSICLALAVNM
jgi:hypothetical protein